MIMVAAIGGNADPVGVELARPGRSKAPSLTRGRSTALDGPTVADPGVRLAAFLEAVLVGRAT